ncbi:hypothetical protein ACHQM5_002410 [Ranunculus cassubicifolius]
MADVTVICKRTVVSTTPIQPGKFHNLSVLDRIMEPYNLRLVFYYQTPVELELGKATKKLSESFSEMLTSFPMVTGRLQKTPQGNWKVKCNDAGVRTIEARAKGSVEDWLKGVDGEKELKLVYWEDMFHKPYFWSTFYLQITDCTHMLADAICATMLVKAWADMTLCGKFTPPNAHLLPFRSNKDVNCLDLMNYYKESTAIISPSTKRYTATTFMFGEEMVKKCMDEARTDEPFVALASLFWLSVSKVKGRNWGAMNMSICVDRRKALGLDKGFFGNCMIFNRVFGEEIKEFGLMNAANAVKDGIEMMGSEGVMDLIEWLESNTGKINGPDDFVCANWEGVDSYSTVFESGVKPVRVSYYFEGVSGEGQVLILPCCDGGLSRVAMVTLREDEAVKLCEQTLILRFSPTILMGEKKN